MPGLATATTANITTINITAAGMPTTSFPRQSSARARYFRHDTDQRDGRRAHGAEQLDWVQRRPFEVRQLSACRLHRGAGLDDECQQGGAEQRNLALVGASGAWPAIANLARPADETRGAAAANGACVAFGACVARHLPDAAARSSG